MNEFSKTVYSERFERKIVTNKLCLQSLTKKGFKHGHQEPNQLHYNVNGTLQHEIEYEQTGQPIQPMPSLVIFDFSFPRYLTQKISAEELA